MYSKIVSAHLPRYLQPVPAAPKACGSCAVFTAEVMVPAGIDHEGFEMLCWLCSHYVTEHGTTPIATGAPRCDCPLDQIYPRALLDALDSVPHVLKS